MRNDLPNTNNNLCGPVHPGIYHNQSGNKGEAMKDDVKLKDEEIKEFLENVVNQELTEGAGLWITTVKTIAKGILSKWNSRPDQKDEGVKRKIDLRICLMNIRRTHTKAWNKRTSNSWLVQEIVGCGNGTAYKICDEININPDKYKINWSEEEG